MNRDESETAIQALYIILKDMPEDVEIVEWRLLESGAPHVRLKVLSERGAEFLRECGFSEG